jgi:diguanylate cyclase (GGDEF)-like protein/PAS domain S-box-containing protein
MNKKTEEDRSSEDLSLFESEQRYRRLFETAQDGILILDASSGLIIDVNPFLINLLGYSRDEFITKRLWEVGAFRDAEANESAFRSLQKKEYIRYKDLPLRTKEGKLIQVEFVSNVYAEGKASVIQCNIRNITEQKKTQDALEKALRDLSVRDHLTGLFNRRYLEETLKREILHSKRNHTRLGIVMLDIDNFKTINDDYGHSAGDIILKEIGQILTENIRGEDTPSRFGGDEFVILIPDAPLEVVFARAELVHSLVQSLDITYERKNLGTITLSIGVAMYPENGSSWKSLMKSVDTALYQAKNWGRNRVVIAGSRPGFL